MRLPNLKSKGASGFTLVEMAIVLVIIGIILAGVMKGRDIVRGAQVKQFSQQFAQKWGTIAQTYYDKTGNVLNDAAVNGGSQATPDGRMDGDLATSIANVVTRLNAVGITPCTLIKSKLNQQGIQSVSGWTPVAQCLQSNVGVNLTQTQVEGEYTGTLNVQADLANMVFTNRGGGGQQEIRNCVILYAVPTDVAIGLDTAIDGTVDGNQGSFVNLADIGQAALASAPFVATQRGFGQGIDTVDFSTDLAWPAASDRGAQICAIILDY